MEKREIGTCVDCKKWTKDKELPQHGVCSSSERLVGGWYGCWYWQEKEQEPELLYEWIFKTGDDYLTTIRTESKLKTMLKNLPAVEFYKKTGRVFTKDGERVE